MNPQVCPPEHRHGEKTTCFFSHRCSCEPCCEAARQYRRRAYRLARQLVPLAPVRAHVIALREYGIGWERLAELSGASVSFIRSVVNGYSIRGREGMFPDGVAPDVAARLRWIQPELKFAGPLDAINSPGTRRRLQALIAAGWSAPLLAEKLDTTRGYVREMAVGTRRFQPAQVHRIARLHEELWDKPPTREHQYEKLAYARALAMARKHSWVTTLAWDDIDEDESPATAEEFEQEDAVDEAAVEQLMCGRRITARRCDYLAAAQRLAEQGESHTAISDRLGWHPTRVSQALRRAAS